jgi:hypothetical protein
MRESNSVRGRDDVVDHIVHRVRQTFWRRWRPPNTNDRIRGIHPLPEGPEHLPDRLLVGPVVQAIVLTLRALRAATD